MGFPEFLFIDGYRKQACTYTWTKNQEGLELVKKRLDIALCNMDWRVSFPNAKAYASPAIGSNHCPIFLQIDTIG